MGVPVVKAIEDIAGGCVTQDGGKLVEMCSTSQERSTKHSQHESKSQFLGCLLACLQINPYNAFFHRCCDICEIYICMEFSVLALAMPIHSFVLDYGIYLDHFSPCISQCMGKVLMLVSP